MNPNRYGECFRFGTQNRPWRPSGFLETFWLHFAPLLAVFSLVLAPCGFLFDFFYLLLALFGSLWALFWLPFCNLFATMALLGATFAPFCTLPTFRMSNFFKHLVFLAPEDATHPLSICFRLLMMSESIWLMMTIRTWSLATERV